MRISIKWPATYSETVIPPGEYEVKVGQESGQILLSMGELTIKLTGSKRPSKHSVTFPAATYRASQGEPIWILQVNTPPKNEWVVFIKMPRPKSDTPDPSEKATKVYKLD